jgi:hypothetical protein
LPLDFFEHFSYIRLGEKSMQDVILNLVKEFPRFKYPGHRSRAQSENSGEEFRDDILIPFIKNNRDHNIIINFEGAVGFPPSFLEEAFGGCVIKGIDEITQVKVIGIDEIEEERIKRYIDKAIETKKAENK